MSDEPDKVWRQILNRIYLDESKSVVIDALIAEFGDDIISKRRYSYGLDQEEVQRIFDVLDQQMFGNRLHDIPIKYFSQKQIVDQLNEHLRKSDFSRKEYYSSIQCYGVHSAIASKIKDQYDVLQDIELHDHVIMINKETINGMPFMLTVSVICHEMIHCYDTLTSSECHQSIIQLVKEIDAGIDSEIDFHNTEIFNKMEKIANENGINVIKSPSPNTTEIELIDSAIVTFEKMLDEDDSEVKIHLSKDKTTIVVQNKKTGNGVITDFFPCAKK